MSDAEKKPAPQGDRLAKVIARAGLCSRRDAETWIVAGRIAVNGSVIRTPAYNVIPGDKVSVDGAPLAERHGTRLWLYHKPAGLVVTESDPEGRETIFESLARHGLPRVVTVGRLDINTEGLLLLTNDGGLKRVLELPATGWLRRYRVRAHGTVTQAQLDALKTGAEVDGTRYGPIEAELERVQGSNVWLLVALREGKNREVKNVLGALGLQVTRLIRVSFGPFQLGDLPIGAVSVVKPRVLKDQLGARLAAAAGVDFDSPMPGDAPPIPGDPNQRLRKTGTELTTAAPRPRGRTGEPVHAKARAAAAGGASGRDAAPRRDARGRPEREEREPRTVHFDDGRASEEFVPRARRPKTEGGGRDARPPRRDDGDRPRGSRPPRDGGDRAAAPRPPRREEGDRPRSPRPPREGAERTGAPRPPRREEGDRPRSPRPPREGAERANAPRRSYREEGAPPSRARAPRDDSERPNGPRPPRRTDHGTASPRPPRPRTPRDAGDPPRSARPRSDQPRTFRDSPGRPAEERATPRRPASPRQGADEAAKPRRDAERRAGPSSGPRKPASRPAGPGGPAGPRKGPPRGRPPRT